MAYGQIRIEMKLECSSLNTVAEREKECPNGGTEAKEGSETWPVQEAGFRNGQAVYPEAARESASRSATRMFLRCLLTYLAQMFCPASRQVAIVTFAGN